MAVEEGEGGGGRGADAESPGRQPNQLTRDPHHPALPAPAPPSTLHTQNIKQGATSRHNQASFTITAITLPVIIVEHIPDPLNPWSTFNVQRPKFKIHRSCDVLVKVFIVNIQF